MFSNPWNKLIAISWALAAAGVLACIGALVNVFVPHASLLGFLFWIAVLGIAVLGIVIAYAWVCNKSHSTFDERIDRLAKKNGLKHKIIFNAKWIGPRA
jgi:hypothetical protein